jgi:hypothetical protein
MGVPEILKAATRAGVESSLPGYQGSELNVNTRNGPRDGHGTCTILHRMILHRMILHV